MLADGDEPATGTDEIEDGHSALSEEKPVDKSVLSNELKLNINLNDVTDLVVRYLQNRLEDNIKSEEVIVSLWDFAGQHLYYASHSVFLSGRAVYILVYNLNKNLLATAEPCVRQGITDTRLDNPNNETNLDNLLSWLVSVHNIRPTANKNLAHQGKKLSYLQPLVIIVGTNLDQPFEEVGTTEKRIRDSIIGKEYAKHVMWTFFAVDNTKKNDEGVRNVRHKIMEVLKDEPYMPEEVPLRYEGQFYPMLIVFSSSNHFIYASVLFSRASHHINWLRMTSMEISLMPQPEFVSRYPKFNSLCSSNKKLTC